MITEVLYYIFIYPMQILLGAVFDWLYTTTHSYGVSIMLLSLCINVFLLKLTNLADKKARATNALKNVCDKKIAEFKKVFKGAELHAYTQTLFKQKHYHPIYNLFSLGGLALQIPFFLGVLFLLQDFEGLQGARFGAIEDLSKPDTLLFGYALLPFVMSILSLISVFVSAKERGARIQGSLIALIFLVLLYVMPSGLVLYWSVSMGFSLLRTLLRLRHLSFGDKSGSLIVGGGHYRLGSSLVSNLHNPDFSSKILECQEGKPSVECKASSESSVGLESSPTDSKDSQKQSIESSLTDSESKIITQSTTSKTLNEALPNINNNGRSSASRAESNFAKSHTNSEFAHTEPHEILASCDDFVGYQARGAGSYLSGSDQAPSVDSRKSAQEANLLSRFKNVLHAIFTPHKDLDSKTYLTYRNISIFALLNIFFLIFVFSPFAVYSSDVSQFDPSQTFQTLGGLFGFFLLFSFLGIYTTSFFYHTRLLKLGVYGVSVILCIGLVYTFVLVGDYGSMNHFVLEKLNFANPDLRAQKYLLFFVVFFGSMMFVGLVLRYLKKVWQFCFIVFVATTPIYCFTIIDTTHNTFQDNGTESFLKPYENELFSYSKVHKNIVVFLLDMFSGSHAPYIFSQFPEIRENFDGFVLYDNTISTTDSTIHSISSIIGGEYYTAYNMNIRGDNLAQTITKAFGENGLAFANNGYQVGYFLSVSSQGANAIRDYAANKIFATDNIALFQNYYYTSLGLVEKLNEVFQTNKDSTIIRLLSVGLFRFSPELFFRPRIYNSGLWLVRDKYTQDALISSQYLSSLYAFSHIHNTNATQPTFKYFHSLATHMPYGVLYENGKCVHFSRQTAWDNKQAEMIYPTPQDKEIYYQHYDTQACALSYIADFIQWLKNEGIYDNTQIFIVSDHGGNDGINILSSRADALLLFKDFNAKGVFKMDSRLMANYDIASIFCENLPQGCANVGKNILEHYPKDREIIHTKPISWMLQSHKKNQWILEKAYRVRDNVYEPKNWHEIDPKIFSKER